MTLPRYALHNRVVICFAVAMLSLWGVFAFVDAPRRETPEFTVRIALVTTNWPGASVEKMEQLVAEPLEQAISTIDEVDRIETKLWPGQAVIRATIDDRTAARDIANLWDELRAEVAKVSLPREQGCQDPVVNSNFGDTAIYLVAVYQDPAAARASPYSSRQLEVFADVLRDDLKQVAAVADAQLHGVREEVIYLETDPRNWTKLRLTTDELAQRLAARNIVTSGGALDLPEGRVSLRPTGDYTAVQEIKRLVTGYDDAGNPVYLEDLGIDVRRGFADPPRMLARFSRPGGPAIDAAEAVVVSVTMKDGRNVVALGEELRRRIATVRATRLPADVQAEVVINAPSVVERTIGAFTTNLGQAVVLVLLVALLLIGPRIALVMAAAIPIVMLGTFATMRLFDVQLEQISIAALIIALGMLVDNAIEVCDNIHRLLGEGRSRREAALVGAQQIGRPILIATLTTIAGFAPMLLALDGAAREYVYSLPVVVSLSLSLSWVLAMTFTTVMSYWLLRHGGGMAPLPWLWSKLRRLGRHRRGAKSAGEPVEREALYPRLVRLAIAWNLGTVLIAGVMFAVAIGLLATGRIGTQFFPSALQTKFVVEVFTAQGAGIASTDRTVRETEQLVTELAALPDGGSRVRDILTFVGSGGPRFDLGFDPADPASNYGVLLLHVDDPEDVDRLLVAVREAAPSRIPGARVRPKKLGMGPPVSNPVGVRVVGPGFADMRTLRAIGERVEEVFRASPRLWDVSDSWGNAGLELRIDVEESRATPAGVSSASVASSLAGYYSGRRLTTFLEGDHDVPVYFRWRPEERRDLDAVLLDPIEGAIGKVPLDGVATGDLQLVPAKLTRRDLNRILEITARPVPGELANTVFLEDVWPRMEEMAATLPPGFRIDAGGEFEESSKAQAKMMFSFQLTLAIVLLLLVVQYNSLSKPLLILVTIPLATTGSFFGLFIFGAPLGFMEMLGLLALVGIVLNAAIVYIEFAQMLIRECLDAGQGVVTDGRRGYCGLDRTTFRDCLQRAGQLRLLPIALTTFTTAGGLLPLALAGGPLFEGMAATIMCGLLLGSVMTLLVLPALLSIFVEWFGLRLLPAEEASDAR